MKGIRSSKNVAPKRFMMAHLKRGQCTVRSTVLAAPPAMVKDKSGEGGQTAVGLDPINEGMQPDVLQRGRAGMACQRSKSQDVRAATWNVSSMVGRSGEVVDAIHRRKIDFCYAQEMRWKVESARMIDAIDKSYFGKAVIRELLVLVCLLAHLKFSDAKHPELHHSKKRPSSRPRRWFTHIDSQINKLLSEARFTRS